jgi:hypothetical protein
MLQMAAMVAGLAAAAAIVTQMPEIRRYLKVRSM